MSLAPRITSTHPATIALFGIAKYFAVVSASAKVKPPSSLIARNPEGAIGPGPGENHANGAVFFLLGK